jgi:hypothetical protein
MNFFRSSSAGISDICQNRSGSERRSGVLEQMKANLKKEQVVECDDTNVIMSELAAET